MAHPLPPAKAVKDLFEELLGRDVTVGRAVPMRSHDLRRTVTAVYVDSALHMVAVIGMDTALAAYAGAAIALVPVGGARECMEENSLPPVLAANATKICESL